MKYDNIRDMFSNTIVKDGQKYLMWTWRATAATRRCSTTSTGLESVKRDYYQEQGTDKTIQLIRDAAATEKIPFSHILVDEDGVGGGVVDQLTGVKGFTANSTPLPTRDDDTAANASAGTSPSTASARSPTSRTSRLSARSSLRS